VIGDIVPDTVIDGRYRVIERLGRGGMAEVYRAHDMQLGREVALKLLYRRFAEDGAFVERFRREASAAAGLQHPNVVSVYDRGEWDGTSYIAMELVPGRTLREIVEQDGPMDPVRAIDLTLGVLRAARFAHRRDIIHRDLKPHNVLVDAEGRAKVADFGIARAGASDMTETGSIMGTAQYLSPEQAQGLAVTPRSDLYAVGVLLYELLVGRVPFDGDSAVSIALKQVSEPPVPPGRVVGGIPPELDDVVLHALEKDPADRFADADAFMAALTEVRDLLTGGLVAGNGAPRTGPHAPRPPRAPALAPPAEPGEGRRRWPWVVLAVVLLLVAAGVAYALLGGTPGGTRVPGVVGQDVGAATQRLRNAGFQVAAERKRSDAPRDRVISQKPGSGGRADRGSTVRISVSDGPGIQELPDVAGKARSEALKSLRRFKVRETRRYDDAVPENRAIETDPVAGTALVRGSAVTLVISRGPRTVAVPDVRGQTRSAAQSALEDAGFAVAVASREDADADAGTVLDQDPRSGRRPKGSTITLTVAKKPPNRAVPSVGGLSQEDATRALEGAGFTVTSVDQDVTDPSQDGTVIDQRPGAATPRPPGSEVTIVVGRLTQATTPQDGTTTAPGTGTDGTNGTLPGDGNGNGNALPGDGGTG
jgi:serine/threonine-protein kinase